MNKTLESLNIVPHLVESQEELTKLIQEDDIIYFIENYVLFNGSHIKLNEFQKQFINYLYDLNTRSTERKKHG